MMPTADQVNTLVVDVDGVLTDGAIHVHENGTQSVRFCVKDGLGLVRWRESGRTLVAITGRDRPEAGASNEKKIPRVRDVLLGLRKVCRENGLDEAFTAFLVGRLALDLCDVDPPI